MGIGQFDISLYSSCLSEDPLVTQNSWITDIKLDRDILSFWNDFLGEPSQNSGFIRWGRKRNLVELYSENLYILKASIRIDLVQFNPMMVEMSCEFSELLGCNIFVPESKALLEPDFDSLNDIIRRSNAWIVTSFIE